MAVGGTETIRLEFPARPEYLSLVRVVVGNVANHGPDLESLRINDLCLAVSEACANAIDAYVCDGRPGETVEVEFAVASERIAVEVVDRAGGFELGASRAAVPAAHPHRERGLGLPLMKVLTDEMDVDVRNGGTAVRLVMLGGRRR
ncbi:MAG: ATP-binding protein [Acidimicrobiales bacterium]